jgi:hypothetical protein
MLSGRYDFSVAEIPELMAEYSQETPPKPLTPVECCHILAQSVAQDIDPMDSKQDQKVQSGLHRLVLMTTDSALSGDSMQPRCLLS